MKGFVLRAVLRNICRTVLLALRIAAEVVGYWFSIVLICCCFYDAHLRSDGVLLWAALGSVAIFAGFQFLHSLID